jgi:bacterial leucyl aminopeptidase
MKIIKEYSHVEAIPYRCNYACGDHYSWYVAGFTSLTYPQEVTTFNDLNPAYHTGDDRLPMFNMTRATEFVKFTLGFAIELSNS